MVKATVKKHIGEVKQKNTGETLRPLYVTQNERVYWYSTLLPDILFPELWDACCIDRYMTTGKHPHRAKRMFARGILKTQILEDKI